MATQVARCHSDTDNTAGVKKGGNASSWPTYQVNFPLEN